MQLALLPHRLPNSEAVSLTSRYLPGGRGLGRRRGLLRRDAHGPCVRRRMGDVQGHNAAAAALMGRVRTAVRAYVSEGHDPAAVLERTNR